MDGKLVFKVTKLFVSVWSDKAKHVKLPALSFYFVSFLSVKNVKLLADLLVKVKTSFRLVPQCSLNNLAQGSEARWLANQRSLCSNKFFQIGRFLLLFWNTRQWYFVWKIWKLFTQQVGTRSDYFKSCSPWCNTKIVKNVINTETKGEHSFLDLFSWTFHISPVRTVNCFSRKTNIDPYFRLHYFLNGLHFLREKEFCRLKPLAKWVVGVLQGI